MTACCYLLDTFICYVLEGIGCQLLNVHTVPSKGGDVNLYHTESEIIGHLNSHNIAVIKPRVDFRLPKPTELHRDQIGALLNSLDVSNPEDVLIDRFYREVEIITMHEFNEALAACCARVNEMISSRYILGIAKNKSQQFVAELALPYLRSLPQEICSVATNSTATGTTGQSPISMKFRDYLIFDDCSYSGSQLHYKILAICMENATNLLTTPRIYIVIPFISSVALEALDSLRGEDIVSQVRIHVITTTRRIKAIKDVFSEEEIAKLKQMFNSPAIHQKCLTMMEWKFADGSSIPRQVRTLNHSGKDYQFVTLHSECYKDKID